MAKKPKPPILNLTPEQEREATDKIKRFMEDEENLSKSAQNIVKTKQQAAGEGAML